MLIYIIRHGQAHNSSESGLDRDRALHDTGHRQAQAIGAYLREREDGPLLLIASPFRRAQETAKWIWEAMEQEEQSDDRLSADRGLTEALDVLIAQQGAESVAIVGHNPTCERLVGVLTQGLNPTPMGHRTGEVAVVRVVGSELVGQGELVERFRLGD